MAAPTHRDVTGLLVAWSAGDASALDELVPLLYDELHRLAERAMRRERPEHTLQPTALVHEAYCRLIDQRRVRFSSRAEFYAAAANTMRRVLVDHARRRRYAKRGGDHQRVTLDEALVAGGERSANLVELDSALAELATFDERKSRVVELRIFGGLTIDETAALLGVSTGTVIHDYQIARAWLFRALSAGQGGAEER